MENGAQDKYCKDSEQKVYTEVDTCMWRLDLGF